MITDASLVRGKRTQRADFSASDEGSDDEGSDGGSDDEGMDGVDLDDEDFDVDDVDEEEFRKMCEEMGLDPNALTAK